MPKADFLDSKTCTLVGLVTNIALAIFKLLAGIFGFSYAMIADAINSFSDCFARGTVYAALRIGEKPPAKKHPYGHANAETIVALLVALIILATGAYVGVSAGHLIAHKHFETPEQVVLDKIRAKSLEIEEVRSVDSLESHRRGSSLGIDIKIAVDSGGTVEQGHQVASEIRKKLISEVRHVQDVMIHVNPYRLTQH